MPTLTVRRDKAWADKLRKYRIIVDGVEIGRLGEGAVLCHEINEKPHVVEAKVDWCGSQPLRLEAHSGDRAVLVRNALRGRRGLLVLACVFFNRRGYLTLDLLP